MEKHENYMRMALDLAVRGTGYVNPNPLVGAVIVKNGKVIGSGWHKKYGDLHAERNALASCTESPEGADMYVTLEPCCHFGKTPPCTEAVISAKIKRVFVGSDDPNPKVAGKGAALLRAHGIEVVTGVLKEECDRINDVFFHYITTNTPFVVYKYAMTADGKISTSSGKSQWISCESSREHVQYTRKRMAAIMTGIGTVLADDPMLTCRLPDPGVHTRIICDSSLRIPADSRIIKTAGEYPVIIATVSDDEQKRRILEEKGAVVVKTDPYEGRVDLVKLMDILANEYRIDSILLEGGSELAFSALKAGIISKVQAYIAPKMFGGAAARTPVGGEGVDSPDEAFMLGMPQILISGEDILLEYTLGADKLCSQE